MKIRKYQRGYTLSELVFVIAFGVVGVGISIVCGFGIYAAIHFIAKVW